MKSTIEAVAGRLESAWHDEPLFAGDRREHMPRRQTVVELLLDIRSAIFPGYYPVEGTPLSVTEHLDRVGWRLSREIASALRAAGQQGDAEELAKRFLLRLPDIQAMLLMDARACFDGDPAARGPEEVIFCYPGFFATLVYRIAHELHLLGVPYVPRIMTEFAHGETGIDIHPGAVIGKHFMIDHGTGVVIGETCVIGDHVRIYQGVTLGALSTRGGQRIAGTRRHPTIEDNVIIYANASVLGGNTVIGANSVIGGSAFITRSVPAGSTVTGQTPIAGGSG
ncbi:MAG: serine acetyltransferase [Christensenellaceae bacterium]|nr:serine acetyltransferase [Christensenellaceae bacterium]